MPYDKIPTYSGAGYVARAFDGQRWVSFLERETFQAAAADYRQLQSLLHGQDEAWLLIELATTDAYARILRQCVACKCGYRTVLGRDADLTEGK
jgi:hypothetical protein